jgi:mRNA interferase RelE/StbE
MCERIDCAIDSLGNDPRPRDVEKLSGHDTYRMRVGDYRVFAVEDVERIVTVARIAHLRELYRR